MKKKPKPKGPRYLLLWTVILGTLIPESKAQTPQVDFPYAIRQKNWSEGRNNGSCVHASAITLWRWQGHYEWAEYWKSKYGGGEYDSRFHSRCDAEGVTYCDTYGERDWGFVEWSCRTRRGCLVAMPSRFFYKGAKGGHAVCVVHVDDKVVGVMNNNSTKTIKWYPVADFKRVWQDHESWAWTPVTMNGPAPPQLSTGGPK